MHFGAGRSGPDGPPRQTDGRRSHSHSGPHGFAPASRQAARRYRGRADDRSRHAAGAGRAARPGRGRDRFGGDRGLRREGRRSRRDDPRRSRLRFRPHLRGAATRPTRERRAGIIVNVQGDLPTLAPADIAAAIGPLADPAVDIATLAAEITRPDERTNPNVVKVVGTPIAAAQAARALFHPRHRAGRRRPALSPHRPLRLSPRRARPVRRACRPRRSNGAKSSSNCARSKPGCAST